MIRSARTCVRIVPAAVEPRVIESVRLPSVCASGTWTVSVCAAGLARSRRRRSSSYAPSSIVDRAGRDRDHRDARQRLGGAGERLEVDRGDEPVDAEDLLALPDRVGIVLPWPAHRPIQHVRDG